MTMRWIALAAVLSSTTAHGLELDLAGEAERHSVSYGCSDDEPREVEYVNAGANSLALLAIEGERRVFVNVIAASGARYVSGQYVWWTKGGEASLENEIADAGEPPVTCEEARS